MPQQCGAIAQEVVADELSPPHRPATINAISARGTEMEASSVPVITGWSASLLLIDEDRCVGC